MLEEDLLWSGGGVFSSLRKLKLQFVSGLHKAADLVKMLNYLSFAQEVRRRYGEEWIVLQDNTVIHNASIIKKYIGLYTPINYFGRYATCSHKDGGRSMFSLGKPLARRTTWYAYNYVGARKFKSCVLSHLQDAYFL